MLVLFTIAAVLATERGPEMRPEREKGTALAAFAGGPSEPCINSAGTGQIDRAETSYHGKTNAPVQSAGVTGPPTRDDMARGAPIFGLRARVTPAPTTNKAPTDQVNDPGRVRTAEH